MSYRIKTVSEMTGIPKATLIAWERRHALVEPRRTASGYRVYSDGEVGLLQRVKSLVDSGYRISEAVDLVRTAPTPAPRTAAPDTLREQLTERLLDFDQAGADRLARQLVVLPFTMALEEIILPLLREVGDAWERGEISIAQEHYASAWCRERVLAMLHAVRPVDPRAPEVICATPPGERHEFGILGAALRLAIAGWRVTYLGADVPLEDLARLAAERAPAMLCLSVVHDRAPEEVRAMVEQLLAAIPEGTRIVVGGAAAEPLRNESTEQVSYGVALQEVARPS
jgi:methanogenic corrinoid protein MtbC1